MYKSNTEFIVIDAKATEPISTNVVFWSHDKGTAKLVFELKKDTIPQSLAEGTKVPVLLEFDSVAAENSRGKHTYFATIDDAINGIVSIVLENNILGYVGRVDGSIYIELPDSRSLDTAGRFTFHIKRSPIDEDVPELEDYYWQGFNEIMEQYHKSISEIKLEAKQLLDDLTLDVNTAKTKVTALEKSITTATTNLNARVDEINKKIDENDVFTKAESSANVIYQLIGKEKVKIDVRLDLLNKTSGSITENPNFVKQGAQNSGVINSPSSANWWELTTNEYLQVAKKDEIVKQIVARQNGGKCQMLFGWNTVDVIKRYLGQTFFDVLGLTTTAEKALYVRNTLAKSYYTEIWGYGNSPSGNKLTSSYWTGSAWASVSTHTSSGIDKLVINTSIVNNKIDNDGMSYVALNAEASNGSIDSVVAVDTAYLTLSIELSMHEFINYMIAANHVENLATETEAAAGTDNTKTMTPLRTKQLLDSKLLNMVYPIGAVYLSVNSASPNTLFGGTWERYAKGRVLVGVDEEDAVLSTAGKQGGSANGVAEHTHITKLTTFRVTTAGSGTVNNLARSTDQGNAMTGEFGSVSSTGDNTDHKNWQPFETVYIWKRIA